MSEEKRPSRFGHFLDAYDKAHAKDVAEKEGVKNLFLTLWDNAVDSPQYDKKKWQEMRAVLSKAGMEV